MPGRHPPTRHRFSFLMIGIICLNLGTPQALSTKAIRSYLREFLNDPRVIDIPAPLRFLLLNAFILPFRPRKALAAYEKVWDKSDTSSLGSPLRRNTASFAQKLGEELGAGYKVEYAMRYADGNRWCEILHRFRAAGVRDIVLFPMYPQYASSSTGSSLEYTYKWLARDWDVFHLKVIPPFFNQTGFIDAQLKLIRNALEHAARVGNPAEHLLLSYHGLPVRHLTKQGGCGLTDGTSGSLACLEKKCGSLTGSSEVPKFCYRAQSYATSEALMEKLRSEVRAHPEKFPLPSFSVSFQSRLGRAEWITPSTETEITQLAKKGIKHLAVVCPSFASDCLETLEEIALRGKELFKQNGGAELTHIACVNDDNDWVRSVAEWVRA